MPQKKELILMAEEYLPNPTILEDCTIGIKLGNTYPKFIHYAIGTRYEKNIAHVGELNFTNKKIGKKYELLKKLNKQYQLYEYQYMLLKKLNKQWEHQELYKYHMNQNSYWLSIKNLLKNMKNTPIDKSNMNMDIIMINEYLYSYGIYAGKIINVYEKEIEIEIDMTNKCYDDFPMRFSPYKNDIVGWTELPNLPNNSMAI